jgi:hypothetical protein
MHVGRALVDGNVLPCTLVPKAPVQGCYVAWNNAENLYKQYEVSVQFFKITLYILFLNYILELYKKNYLK